VPHHRGLPFEEGLPQRAPFDGALGHDAVLGRKRLPEFQGIDDSGIVEIGLKPVVRHQFLAVLDRQRLEHPVGIAGRGDHQAPGAVPGQRLAHLDDLVPGGGRPFRIKARSTEHVLVVVRDDGGALERHAPGLALDLAVGHQRGVEAVEPGAVFRGLDHLLEGNDQILLDQVVGVDREHHRELGGIARVERG
jgi:hypothetical protein